MGMMNLWCFHEYRNVVILYKLRRSYKVPIINIKQLLVTISLQTLITWFCVLMYMSRHSTKTNKGRESS